MGMMIDGRWQAGDVRTAGAGGRFVRRESAYRDAVTADGSSGFPAEAGRYHLYVAWACPWAHRTMIFRALLGLEDAISLSAVDAFMGDDGWTFPAPDRAERRDAPVRGLRARESDVHRQGDRADPVGQAAQHHRQQRVLGNHPHARAASSAPSPARRTTSIPRTCAGRSTRSTRASTRRSTTACTAPASRRRRRRTTKRCARCSNHSTGWTRGSRRGATSPATASPKPTGGCSRRCIRFDAVYYGHFKCNLRHVYEYPHLWGYRARAVPVARRRRDGELRRDQAALLREPQDHQSVGHRADGAGAGSVDAAWTRLRTSTVEVVCECRQTVLRFRPSEADPRGQAGRRLRAPSARRAHARTNDPARSAHSIQPRWAESNATQATTPPSPPKPSPPAPSASTRPGSSRPSRRAWCRAVRSRGRSCASGSRAAPSPSSCRRSACR